MRHFGCIGALLAVLCMAGLLVGLAARQDGRAEAGGVITATLAGSEARTTGANGDAVGNLGDFPAYTAILSVTDAQDAAGDTLDVYVDGSPDGGATWINIGHFTQVLGNGANTLTFRGPIETVDGGGLAENVTSDAAAGVFRPGLVLPTMRARWAIADGGGAHSFTFKVILMGKS